MIHYEILILTVPEITSAESSNLEDQFEGIVKNNDGTVQSFERWGKYRLAYPVWNNDYGVYFLVRFDVDAKNIGSLMKEIDSLFRLKLPQLVMRSMNTKLDPKKSMMYQKPESLEDIPTQDVDKFLRENKMQGLIKTRPEGSTKKAASSKEKPAVIKEEVVESAEVKG